MSGRTRTLLTQVGLQGYVAADGIPPLGDVNGFQRLFQGTRTAAANDCHKSHSI